MAAPVPVSPAGQLTGSVPVPDPTALTTAQLEKQIAGLRELLEAKLDGQNAEQEQLRQRMERVDIALQERVTGATKVLDTRLSGMDKAIELLQRISDQFPDRVDERISGVREVLETRLTASDKALELLGTSATQFPNRIDEKIKALESTLDERFKSIQTQFTERDVRTEGTSRDSKIAVDAALQAAKEAVGEQNKSSALAIAKSETATNKQIEQLGSQMVVTTKATDDKIDDLKDRMTRMEGSGIGTSMAMKNTQTNASIAIAIVAAIFGAVGVGTAIILALTR